MQESNLKFYEFDVAFQDAKNKDYGNVFAKTYKKYGPLMPVIRMDDKISRYERLTKYDKANIKTESVFDTMLDLVNYSIMTFAVLKKQSFAGVLERVILNVEDENEPWHNIETQLFRIAHDDLFNTVKQKWSTNDDLLFRVAVLAEIAVKQVLYMIEQNPTLIQEMI